MAKENKNKKNKKKKKTTGMAVALWFLALLVIIIIFLAKKDTILTNLKQTKFFERIGLTTPDFVKNHPDEKITTKKQNDLIQIDVEPETPKAPDATETSAKTEKPNEKEKLPTEPKKEPEKNPEPETITDKNAKEQPSEPKKSEPESTTQKTEQKPETPKQAEKPKPQTINATLYFVQIDGDGRVNLKPCPRTLTKTDSPLTAVLNALLAGPSYEEKTKGAMTAIPDGTRLIGAKVKNGVAELNFNEEFLINPLGVEGHLAQLRQIVYTATTFSTVTSVQFLIDGQKIDYLSEGVPIGKPIGR